MLNESSDSEIGDQNVGGLRHRLNLNVGGGGGSGGGSGGGDSGATDDAGDRTSGGGGVLDAARLFGDATDISGLSITPADQEAIERVKNLQTTKSYGRHLKKLFFLFSAQSSWIS